MYIIGDANLPVYIIGDAKLFALGQANIERVGDSESSEAEHHGDYEPHVDERFFLGDVEDFVLRRKVDG